MRKFNRVILIVLDSLGVGELPDAADYGDEGSDTLDNLIKAAGGIDIPNLASFGLGLIEGVDNVDKGKSPVGCYGRMKEVSPGKDTATGHWEMSGIILEKPFPTYLQGFPPEIMEKFTRETGYGWLGGMPASGTEIIDRYGEEHLRTKKLIVYTSADSVFQIAAHEELIPIDELYRVCEKTREFLYEYNIGRVIARPFLGVPGSFRRTDRRKDYAIAPSSETILERLADRGIPVVGIGKIGDIFVHKGLSEEIHTTGDNDGLDKTIEALKSGKSGLIFTNLVDLDTSYGHRNDPVGYAQALSGIDKRLPEITALLGDDDILFITGDHGCDPTTPSTDHSREYVPLLAYGKKIKSGVDLGTRQTFSDLGQTIAEIFGVGKISNGISFLPDILK
ncbi:MAG: phosphopentomutase [Deltaproteobacteria bacterium]|nr:phosphopentomutase [Deltaproteobacteria bacterium]